MKELRLGDRVQAVVHHFQPPIESTASVIEYRQNLNDKRLSECTLGHFRARGDLSERLKGIEEDYGNKRGEWDKKPDKIKSELEEEIDNVLDETREHIDEANERIERAKQELEETVDNIERTKIDLKDAEGTINNAISRPQDYQGYFDGDIAARSITLWDEVISNNARFTGTVRGNNLSFIDGEFERAFIIDAIIRDAAITGTLEGVDGRFTGTLDGNFLGTVTAENIQGRRISGVIFETGSMNDKRVWVREQQIRFYEGNTIKSAFWIP